MKKIKRILWDFHNELKDQQRTGRSATQGNTEIFCKAQSSLKELMLEVIREGGEEEIYLAREWDRGYATAKQEDRQAIEKLFGNKIGGKNE